MTKRILAALGLIAAATTAQAQDSIDYNYDGGYIGAFSGASFFQVEASDQTDTFANDAPPINELILNYGVNIGYNWTPYEDNFLLGLELDIQGGNETNQLIALNEDGTNGQLFENQISSLTTVRGRAGLINGNVLTYLTSGVSFAQVDYNITGLRPTEGGDSCDTPGIRCASFSDSLLGLTIGMGMEYAFREDTTMRFQIMQHAFESASTELKNGQNTLCSVDNSDECTAFFASSLTQFSFGVNYQF